MTHPDNIKALAAKYHGKPIYILLNNAGILEDIPKDRSVLWMVRSSCAYVNNVLGALLVTEAFATVVASSQKKIIGVSRHAGLTSAGDAGTRFTASARPR